MRVRDVMTGEVISTTTETPFENVLWPRVVSMSARDALVDAARKMREFDVGTVLVYDGDALIGIITERDLLRAYVDGASLDSTAVVDYMASSPRTVAVGTEVGDAASLMLQSAARHLAVVDGEHVVGIVSVRDLMAFFAGRPLLFRAAGA
jgi:CBS domain-containing protein